MIKYYIDDIPESYTTIAWLKKNTDWENKISKVTSSYTSDISVYKFKVKNFDTEKMAKCIFDIIKVHGEYDYKWDYHLGNKGSYSGFSLVYNPNYVNLLDNNNPILNQHDHIRANPVLLWNSQNRHTTQKNTYYDIYGFNIFTTASQQGYLGSFLERGLRTRVRSRVGILEGEYVIDVSNNERGSGWHKDEPIFENFRVNIPITTNENFLLQLENKPPIKLDLGYAYSWDTRKLHRVFNTKKSNFRRINLVLGFSPWWDYLTEERAWIKNKFYGEKHPFDMLIDGDIFSDLEFLGDGYETIN